PPVPTRRTYVPESAWTTTDALPRRRTHWGRCRETSLPPTERQFRFLRRNATLARADEHSPSRRNWGRAMPLPTAPPGAFGPRHFNQLVPHPGHQLTHTPPAHAHKITS